MFYRIAEEVFEKLPDMCVGVVVVRGLDNCIRYPRIAELLCSGIAEREAYFEGKKVKEDPLILPYREAFRAVDINPNKFLCSIEALFTRIAKKKGFPEINAIVDLGNAMSLKYGLPIGAHDLATMKEGLEVRLAQENDTFLPFGGTETEKPDPGEVVYVSGTEVRTRRWTWRQSEIGKISEETSDVLFPIDGFVGINDGAVRAAMEEFVGLLQEIFGAEAVLGFVDKDHTEFVFQ
jgi:DNA/RNA-binding domain of Phe-tRNA-synthetase-like protein